MPPLPAHLKQKLRPATASATALPLRKATVTSPKSGKARTSRLEPSIYPGIRAGKPMLCPRCGTALQRCLRCGMTCIRCNSLFSDWENNCSQSKCHDQRLVCAKCKRPV